MKQRYIVFVSALLIFFSTNLLRAEKISGYVKAETETENSTYPLIGASVFWENTSVGTTTDVTGYFEIERSLTSNRLVIAFVGYESDTIIVDNTTDKLDIILSKGYEIDEVTITESVDGQFNSTVSVEAKTIITDAGLNKLPCCNLSESFENNASVDVSYSDAVTGAKQIKMLGLAGIYSQILRENMPTVRGLSANYGLTYIPGTWMESVQISKGAATVVNGYESITGQINIEFRKPEDSEKLYYNLYGNSEGKFETNLTSSYKLNEKVSTIFMLHGSRLDFIHDQNGDGFADMPLMSQYNFFNKWKISHKGKVNAQIGLRFLQDTRDGGQIDFIENENDNGNFYGIGVKTRQYELFGKFGFLFPDKEHSSLGSMFSFSRHEQNSFFGNKTYSGIHNSFYSNVIINTIVSTTASNLSFGGSFIYDDYIEYFNEIDFSRKEIVPGVFFQYTYIVPQKFSLIAGLRTDYHNIHGLFYTPRIHMKYEINNYITLRTSAGKAYRTANIFAENQSIFSSSRVLMIEEDFKPEEAWNYGLNLSTKIPFSIKKEISIHLDFYRTDFVNQLVADINSNAREIRFYNLKGKSYANSFQAEIAIEPIKGFDISGAVRYNDVRITMNERLIEKPLVNKFKGLVSMSYATKFKKWMFDLTNQFVGVSPLADLSSNPIHLQLEEKSPSYYILHAQITKRFKRLDIYVGAENITNYKQKQLIIDAENPFGEFFDASMIWGPVTGRKYYAGIRFKIK